MIYELYDGDGYTQDFGAILEGPEGVDLIAIWRAGGFDCDQSGYDAFVKRLVDCHGFRVVETEFLHLNYGDPYYDDEEPPRYDKDGNSHFDKKVETS